MLFNSYEFILIFLPIVLSIFYFLRKYRFAESSIGFLVFSSLFFYGWWNYKYVSLIILSMLFNFIIGNIFPRVYGNIRKIILIFGISVNLASLGYFKYADFFIKNVNYISGVEFPTLNLFLPLAISFFTFQQIAYICDVYSGKAKEYRFIHYALFVTFFPN